MFLACRRGKQTVFLEPSEADKVQKVIDVLADLLAKEPEQVALVHKGKMLENNKVRPDEDSVGA